MSTRERRKPGLWLVIPAYNEAGAIGAVLSGLHKYLPRVVVVDDGSSDRTSEIALESGAAVVRHAINLGQGAALQTAIDYALARNAARICTFDADGQHDPDSIAALNTALTSAGAAAALGWRFFVSGL